MVGPNGLEPSTSSVSRKRSNQTELRAYMRMAVASILPGTGNYGNVARSVRECKIIHPLRGALTTWAAFLTIGQQQRHRLARVAFAPPPGENRGREESSES